jgi:hypothetical protein
LHVSNASCRPMQHPHSFESSGAGWCGGMDKCGLPGLPGLRSHNDVARWAPDTGKHLPCPCTPGPEKRSGC